MTSPLVMRRGCRTTRCCLGGTTRRPAKAVADGGFHELPVTFEHAEAVRALPRHHADPFDRLIIAAAGVEGCTIVTSDEKFSMYDVALLNARR